MNAEAVFRQWHWVEVALGVILGIVGIYRHDASDGPFVMWIFIGAIRSWRITTLEETLALALTR